MDLDASNSPPVEGILRLDAPDRARGAPAYSTDIQMPGMLHAKVVRSHVPRGRVISVGIEAAAQVPGVVAFVTGKDVNGSQPGFPTLRPIPGQKGTPPGSDWPTGFRVFPEIVDFAGEGIVAVAAETLEAAQEAADLIDVEIEELPPVLTMEQALAPNAPQLDTHGNLLQPPWTYEKGDIDRAFAEADFVFEDTYRTPRQAHAIIEPLCAVAAVEKGLLTVWTVMNSPYEILQEMAALLGMKENQIRVVCTAGPSYGARDNVINSMEPVCALLAMKTGRPVRIALTSEEMFQVSRTRHESRFHIKTGVASDGRILAMSGDVVINGGAYSLLAGRVIESIASKFLGLYKVPNLHFEGRAVRTNTLPAGSYRSVASVQNSFALETQLNKIAKALSIDPIELRQKNHIKSGDKLLWGTVVDASPLERCISLGAEKFGWAPNKPPTRRGEKAIGQGMAISMHHTGVGNVTREGSAIRVQLTEDGRIKVTTSIPDNGQGALTTLTVMASKALNLPVEAIEMRMGDTFEAPLDYMGAGVNRVTYITGTALRQACKELKTMLEAMAGEVPLPASALNTLDGLQRLAQWCSTSRGRPLPQIESEFHPPDMDPAPTYAAHFAEVEVDTKTGEVKVLKYVAAQDMGEVILPDICEIQVEGGVYHGAGLALREELYVEDGMVTNGNFMEYSVGGIGESFPVDVVLVETDGAPPRGVGTSVAPPVAPAIASAVADATGQFIREVPVTPSRVLKSLGKL